MATELLPVVDLRALSQSDLDALADASAHALSPRSCPDADLLQPLKIDRTVFNESAGSRKQTFSRLRLGAASSSAASAHPTSPSSARASSSRNDPDSRLVAYHLRCLFAPDDPSLPPPPESQTLALTEPSPSPPPDPDRETTNSKAISVDLVRLAGMVDPYDAELRRRTAGMVSETELFGFIASVAGQWVSQRRRRKFVDASFFGDHLPRGWRLQLGLKRKERTAWVHCFSYVSPKGNQFSTCKEVSSYLMSLLGYPEAKTVTIQYDRTAQHHLCVNTGDNNALGSQHQIGSCVDSPNAVRVTFSSFASDLQDKLNVYECQKCNLTFCDQSAYVQHHLRSHEVSTKRRRTSKFGEPVVGKDGKFECPICHKTFVEESRYFGHVGAHARYQGLTPEAFLDKTSSGKVVNDSLAEISFTLQELTESPGQNNNISAGEAGFRQTNYSNEHGANSSEVTQLFSTNCSDNFIRPNEAWHRSQEIHPIADAPSVCRYTNDIMVGSDVTVPKAVSNSNDQPDGTINGFAKVTVFNNQVGSDHVSRPTTLRNANHYENQIVDHGMTTPKHGEINNTVKARDVNLNSSLDTISFPIASANNETSAVHNEANRSSVTAKCISGSFNNNDCASSVSSCSGSTTKISSSCTVNKTSTAASRCFSASYGNDNCAVKANIFSIKNNTVVHQSDLGTRPVSHMATKADCFASCSMQSKNSDKERASDPKEQMDNMTNRTSYEAGFGEAYNNGILTGGVTERGFAQFSNSFTRIKPNASSHCSRPEYNTLTASNFKGSDFNCMMKGSSVNRGDMNNMKGSFVNRPISNNEPNVPMHEVIGKSNNETLHIYNNSASGCDQLAASSTSRNVNGLMSMQANFGSMSSVVRSVGDVPMSSTSQDQCDLHLGFGAHKQQIFSSQGEVRSAVGSPQLGSIAKNNSSPTRSSQFGSTARPKSFPTGSHQFGGFARPNFVPAASSPFGSMARPSSVPPARSSHFGSMAQPNSVPPAGSSQFGSIARPNSVPPTTSSQFGCTARPNSIAPAESAQFGCMAQPNSAPPVKSSQCGSMSGPNSVTPAVSSQFANMPSQNFVSTPEPTLVLGYAQQMGNGPPGQLGWDLSLSRMANGGGGMLTCVCIWCNSQFHHFGPVDGPQAGTFAFICPACKDRMSVRNMPNNGSWQP